ncbi:MULTISPECIES: hypothetical protein [Brevibacillus]|nr:MULTISPECIES: hypothetical protein [Brevibacillus]MDC0760257.1 hypothetical protein [Brevibacillus sp. AG]MED1803053.1 hypothetical protein [Brevibacillus porteri]MED2135259.1 hypothetical protein [Brevibacillus porteri]MED2747938.1 hypothetical protein [Brevibacillus porteri]MED2816124.1 hypothetical protein [Brevibacillus porteri]
MHRDVSNYFLLLTKIRLGMTQKKERLSSHSFLFLTPATPVAKAM